MKCVQTMNLKDDLKYYSSVNFNLSNIMPVWKHHKLIFSGSVMMAYEYDKNTFPNQIDEFVPIGTYF